MHLFSMQSFIIHVYMCVHLIIALFRVMSCFSMGPFDGLQTNYLKFGCFRCNERLMDTCTQSAGTVSHPKTAWLLCLWKWVTQDVLVAKWLTLPVLSVTSGFRGQSLLHQSGSQHKAVWYCKTSNPWPSVPFCEHKDIHTRHILYIVKIFAGDKRWAVSSQGRYHPFHFHTFPFFSPRSCVIKEKNWFKLECRGAEDYSTRSPYVLLFILFSGWLHSFNMMNGNATVQ